LVKDADLVRDALEWSITQSAHSGRVSWQFIQDLAGRLGHKAADDVSCERRARADRH